MPDEILKNCAHEIRRELRHADEAGRAALEGWTLLSLSTVAREHGWDRKGEPSWLPEAVAIIERELGEQISLSTVAVGVGVHRATLAAAFRRFRNVSVGEWIRARRVRHVMHALISSKMPLCKVATRSGFHDQAHMGRVFRKATGLSIRRVS